MYVKYFQSLKLENFVLGVKSFTLSFLCVEFDLTDNGEISLEGFHFLLKASEWHFLDLKGGIVVLPECVDIFCRLFASGTHIIENVFTVI